MKFAMGLFLVMVVVAFCVSPGAAETLTGVVRDPSGAPIPDAFVSVNGIAPQHVKDDGVYTVNYTVPRTMTIWADAFGYARRAFAPFEMTESMVKDLVLIPADEYIGYNWDFELPGNTGTGADGWDIYFFVAGYYNWVTTDNHTPGGRACLNLYPRSPETKCGIINLEDRWTPIDPTAAYSVWYYAKNNGYGSGNMQIEWMNAAKTGYTRVDSSPLASEPANWTRYNVITYKGLMAGSAYMKIKWYHTDVRSNCYLDDIRWDYYSPIVSGNSIRKVRNAGDAATTSLSGKIVTAYGGNLGEGVAYIEEPDRSSGIRVEGVTDPLAAGQSVDVSGTVGTTAGGERKINATTVTVEAGSPLVTLGATTRAFRDRLMAGLYVRAWGSVTPDTAESYFIDDGAGAIKVLGTPPAESYTTLTAVVSYYNGPLLIAVP